MIFYEYFSWKLDQPESWTYFREGEAQAREVTAGRYFPTEIEVEIKAEKKLLEFKFPQ